MARIGTSQLALLLLIVSLNVTSVSSCWAFHLGDHRQATQIAFQETQHCIPSLMDAIPQAEENFVTSAVLQEDLNLPRKWSYYSHYYNPDKKLKMRRADSMVSVSEVQQAFAQDPNLFRTKQGLQLLGRAIHYIQDGAVPAHVVPISHGYHDGLEAYSLAPLEPSKDCHWANPNSQDTLEGILKAIALQTSNRLYHELLTYSRGKNLAMVEQASWAFLFWTPALGPDFGSYGFFGNRFGQAQFEIDGEKFNLDPGQFDLFKSGQLRLAILGTNQAIAWFISKSRQLKSSQ